MFNIIHDAVHHALFTKPRLNRRASLLLDFLGGNSFVWGKRHVLYHHTFTNVSGWDIDIQQSEIVKFNPHQPHKKLYRFQHFYMPLLYLFYSLNWILVRDFKDFFNQKSLVKQKTTIAHAEYIKLFAFKIFYFAFILIVPILVLKMHWYQYLFGFVIMHWLTSALTLLVLLPSHLDEDAQFPEPDENLYLQDTWAIRQLKVTNDFGTNEPILNFLMGGLNHHIAHHLFPTVNHNIIPHITKYIAIRAKENNLPYKCYTLRQVMISHFKLLKKCGQMDFFEE
jgi:linoleoyl-CoA desaturase